MPSPCLSTSPEDETRKAFFFLALMNNFSVSASRAGEVELVLSEVPLLCCSWEQAIALQPQEPQGLFIPG